MNANEIRIGNIVYVDWIDAGRKIETNYGVHWQDLHYGSPCIVMDTTPTGYGVNLQAVQPIPLTEEWLIKFGFEEKTYINGDGDEFDWYTNGKIDLNAGYQPTGDDGTSDSILPYEMKYVHQLQNLYFALTGEELTLTK